MSDTPAPDQPESSPVEPSETVNDAEEAEPVTSPSIDEQLDQPPRFMRGDALSDAEATAVCRRAQTTVVILAGGYRTGKTTLLGAIYEHFQQEPLVEWSFAGSRTLIGFERRVHGYRVASGNDPGKTERSSPLQDPWLHLEVAQPRARRQLLFGDTAGETYDRLRKGEIAPNDLPQLRRADHLGIIIDAYNLTRPREVHGERSRAGILLRTILEGDAFSSISALCFVVTKLDALLQSKTDGLALVDEVVRDLREIVGDAEDASGIPVFRTAAQPRTADFPVGHGVDEFFAHITANPSQYRTQEAEDTPLRRNAFERFAFRSSR